MEQNVLLLYMSLYNLKFESGKKPRPQTNETAVTALYKDIRNSAGGFPGRRTLVLP